MSITDELREFAPHVDPGKVALAGWKDALLAIADHIDAAHRSALEKLAAQLDESKDGWVRLPEDADGVPIHLGDDVTSDYHESGTVVGVQLIVNANGHVITTIAVRPHGWDTPTWYDPEGYRHYLAPTVEDVLREFADRVCNSGHQWGLDAADTIAEFAAKLRLAGEDA